MSHVLTAPGVSPVVELVRSAEKPLSARMILAQLPEPRPDLPALVALLNELVGEKLLRAITNDGPNTQYAPHVEKPAGRSKAAADSDSAPPPRAESKSQTVTDFLQRAGRK